MPLAILPAAVLGGTGRILPLACPIRFLGLCSDWDRPQETDREWVNSSRAAVDGSHHQKVPFDEVCDCQEPKIFNDQPALCEMNKFNAMMSCLPGFHRRLEFRWSLRWRQRSVVIVIAE